MLAFVLGAVLVLGLVFEPLYLGQYDSDAWEHIAAIRELMANWRAPAHPQVVTDAPSRQFHPYFLCLAALGNGFGLSPTQAFALGGGLVAAGLLTGVHAFARAYFGSNPFAASVVLVCVLGVWGVPWIYAGMHSARSLLHTVGYPSTMVLTLSLWWTTRVLHPFRSTVLTATFLVVLVAIGFITHPFQALIGVGFGACVVWGAAVQRLPLYVASCAAGIALAGLWPYFNVLDLILTSAGGEGFRGHGAYAQPLSVLAVAGPAVFAFFCSVPLWKHRADRGFVLCFSALTAAFVVGTALGHPLAHRLLAPALLAAQLVIAAALIRPALGCSIRRGLKVAVIVLFGVQLAIACSEYARMVYFRGTGEWVFGSFPYVPTIVNDYNTVKAALPSHAVVAAAQEIALPAGALGLKLISHPRVSSFIADASQRSLATRQAVIGQRASTPGAALVPTHVIVPARASDHPPLQGHRIVVRTATLVLLEVPAALR